jgi:hypothetical protein
MILIKLRKNFPDIINHELRQLSIIILYNETKELSVIIIDNVADFFLEWKWCKLLPLELRGILSDLKNMNSILNFESFVHINLHPLVGIVL